MVDTHAASIEGTAMVESFAWPDGQRAAISLTFDDARPSQLSRGLPILDRHGVKASFYVTLGSMEDRLSEWQEAVARGHEIGNHTTTHPCSGNYAFARQNALENYTLQQIEDDILQASQAIERRLELTPSTFAYPCGQTFVGRGESRRSYVPVVARRFLVGRRAFDEVANDPPFCDLACATGVDMDGVSWPQIQTVLEQTVKEGRWLILVGHDVGDGGPQTVLAESLDSLCRYCRESGRGLWIDTVAAIGSYVAGVQSRTIPHKDPI